MLTLTAGQFADDADYAGIEARDGYWWKVIRIRYPRKVQGAIEMEAQCLLETEVKGLLDGFVSTTQYTLTRPVGSGPDSLYLGSWGGTNNEICPLTGIGGSFGLGECSTVAAEPGVPVAGKTKLTASSCVGTIMAQSWCTNTGRTALRYGRDGGELRDSYGVDLPVGSTSYRIPGFALPSTTYCYLTGFDNLHADSRVATSYFYFADDGITRVDGWTLYKNDTVLGAHATCVPYSQR